VSFRWYNPPSDEGESSRPARKEKRSADAFPLLSSKRLLLACAASNLADALKLGAVEHLREYRLGYTDAVLHSLHVSVLVEHEAHLGLERLECHGASHDDAICTRRLPPVHGAPVVEDDHLALLQHALDLERVAVDL